MGRAEDLIKKIKKEGEAAINELILTKKSEELFLDFKRSTDNGSGPLLHQRDRENLAKAISGFGNSEGGVLIWGISCGEDIHSHADIPRTKVLIRDVTKFTSWLEGSISGCTVPPHTKVQNFPIVINEKGEGFVITYIPKSVHAPHQVVRKNQYYMRAGSSFVPVPHAVLSGMFGRRPQPHVFPMFTIGPAKVIDDKIRMQMGILISNDGPGIASDLFLNGTIISHPGDNCELSFDPQSVSWEGQFAFGRIIHLISKEKVRLAPGAFVQPCVITLTIAPPFTEDLVIEIHCGCGQSPAYKFRRGTDRASIETQYGVFLEKYRKKLLTKEDMHDLSQKIFGLEKEEISSDIEEV